MKLGPVYEDGGKLWQDVEFDQGEFVPEGAESRDRLPPTWGKSPNVGSRPASGFEYRVPAGPAIPKTWQFRHEPWVPPVPRTLADVPDDVDVIAAMSRFRDSELYVMRQRNGAAFYSTMDGENRSNGPAGIFKFVRYLDQPPAKVMSLNDVPDGRVITRPGNESLYWRHIGNWISHSPSGGWIRSASNAAEFTDFTVTDLVAEFK